MKGIIEINGLRLFARHGVFEEERINGNTFELTVHLCYPIENAMQSDNVADTLNYAEAIEIIRKEMEIPSRLLEHVVGRIHSAFACSLSGYHIRLDQADKAQSADSCRH